MDGTTPNGAASNVSSAYGGSASDRQIIERSSILNQGKKGKSQLEPEEFDRGRRVASKRIHVERVIGLVKRFTILKQELPSTKVPLASRIVYICFMLSNLRNRIVDISA